MRAEKKLKLNAERKASVDLGRAFSKNIRETHDMDGIRRMLASGQDQRAKFLAGEFEQQDENGYPEVVGILALVQFESGVVHVQRHGVFFLDKEVQTLHSLTQAANARYTTSLYQTIYAPSASKDDGGDN